MLAVTGKGDAVAVYREVEGAFKHPVLHVLGDAAKTLVFRYICLAGLCRDCLFTQAPERRSAVFPVCFAVVLLRFVIFLAF